MNKKNVFRMVPLALLSLLASAPSPASAETIVDGVVVDDGGGAATPNALSRAGSRSRARSQPGTSAVPGTNALTSSSVDFDTPKLFSDALPLRIFQSFKTGALFIGKGAVIDAESFEVTGVSGSSILGFNGRTAVNGDGSVPALPEMVVFLKSNGLGLAPKQTVSVDVASNRDDGRTVRLIAFNKFFRMVTAASITVTPQMQTLTVSTASPQIVMVALYGDSELKVLAVDNLRYN